MNIGVITLVRLPIRKIVNPSETGLCLLGQAGMLTLQSRCPLGEFGPAVHILFELGFEGLLLGE